MAYFRYRWLAPAAVSAVWILLSVKQLARFLRPTANAAVCALVAALIFASYILFQRLSIRWRPRWTAVALAAGWAFAAVAYAALYPLSVRHVLGPGSDRENALQVACHAWLSGEFPYSHYTVMHNPITPMPGALLFAMPFYAMGRIGLQNLFWLAIFTWWIGRYFQRTWMGVWFLFTLVYFDPCVMQDVVTGGDFFTCLLYVVVLFSFAVHAATSSDARVGRWVWPIILGVGLSSRPIYSLLYPSLFAVVLHRAGLVAALRTVALTVASMAAVTLPIYLWDPLHFTPFIVGSNAYALVPAQLHPAALTFAAGLAVSSLGLIGNTDLRRALGLGGCALVLVTLPFFIVDRLLQPELFPLINLIYLSPGLLLVTLWLLRSERFGASVSAT